ncbi:DUF6444 domain-containing protein [Candidatus Enterovibrio escicola]|uniref:DUF6444 domain-containing protein n=1 Tax=Candidatus Enterovibrio escicola TaxID=1927127 RepID=UPI003C12FD0B
MEQLGSDQANALTRKLQNKLREYEDRLSANLRNSSRSPPSDSPAERNERKKINTLRSRNQIGAHLAMRDKKDQ